MNKSELIDAIAISTELTKVQVTKVVNAFAEQFTTALKQGDKVTLPGFLTASVTERPARKGRNPQTGKDIDIPAKNIVKVKVGKSLQDAVN